MFAIDATFLANFSLTLSYKGSPQPPYTDHLTHPDRILARIVYMTTLPVADARAQLSRLVDEAERTHERFEITRNGHRAAVLLGADDYDALRETIAVLADESLLADHITGMAEVQADDVLDADSLAEFLAAAKTDDE